MHVERTKEHEWLTALVGEWTFEHECAPEPGKPPVKLSGTEVVRSLGGLWYIGEGTGQMPDGDTGRTVITLGFDPATQRFVGTFIGSMMTHLWIYNGSLDASGKILSLNTVGPSFTGKGMSNYVDSLEIVTPDHRILRSKLQQDDGTWVEFMTANYRRKK